MGIKKLTDTVPDPRLDSVLEELAREGLIQRTAKGVSLPGTVLYNDPSMKRIALFSALLLMPAYFSVGVLAQSSSVTDLSQQARIELTNAFSPLVSTKVACVKCRVDVWLPRKRLGYQRKFSCSRGNEKRYLSSNRIISVHPSERLETQELDTSNIDLVLANYRKDLAVYGNAVAQHGVALNDLLGMNCVNDPSLFLSQLEAVRASHATLKSEVRRLSKIITSDVPSVLQINIERARIRAKADRVHEKRAA